ncbi:hypothetical protein Sjap_019353 [Stephania japonica]|uniref:Uncharacterized protein n=1 Tax=Stephania japonica TaxID=461633 RepID=A0AAP0F7I4_9MAGN
MYARTWNSRKEKIKGLVSSIRCNEFLVIYINCFALEFVIIEVGIQAQYRCSCRYCITCVLSKKF